MTRAARRSRRRPEPLPGRLESSKAAGASRAHRLPRPSPRRSHRLSVRPKPVQSWWRTSSSTSASPTSACFDRVLKAEAGPRASSPRGGAVRRGRLGGALVIAVCGRGWTRILQAAPPRRPRSCAPSAPPTPERKTIPPPTARERRSSAPHRRIVMPGLARAQDTIYWPPSAAARLLPVPAPGGTVGGALRPQVLGLSGQAAGSDHGEQRWTRALRGVTAAVMACPLHLESGGVAFARARVRRRLLWPRAGLRRESEDKQVLALPARARATRAAGGTAGVDVAGARRRLAISAALRYYRADNSMPTLHQPSAIVEVRSGLGTPASLINGRLLPPLTNYHHASSPRPRAKKFALFVVSRERARNLCEVRVVFGALQISGGFGSADDRRTPPRKRA